MKKVLIIEDDPIVAHIYRTRLEKEGYAVETCEDGQSGFYRVHEYQPDAVLLDLMLPKINGVDILKKIRAQAKFSAVPIIVFTNAYVPNMIQEASSAGASQVFNKATLTPRQILDALHILLNNTAGGSGSAAPSPSRTDPGHHAPNSQRGSTQPFGGLAESSFHNPYAAGSPPPPKNYISPLELPSPEAEPSPKPGRVPKISSDDSAFQLELQQAFTATKHASLAALRKLLQEFTKAPDEASRQPHLVELYRKIHALTGSAGIAGFTRIARLTAAVEVLLKELQEKPKNINASTLRTVAHSIDFLGELFKSDQAEDGETPAASILVVDDEILSRRAISYALEKAGLVSTNIEDPAVALTLATENAYDLIFLDVQMPGMDGFELCTRIRALPRNKTAPIIFVTSLTDFKSRAKSSLSGGNDLIAKPFMFIELTVKALTHILKHQASPQRQAA